jgi:hypothetical protein
MSPPANGHEIKAEPCLITVKEGAISALSPVWHQRGRERKTERGEERIREREGRE